MAGYESTQEQQTKKKKKRKQRKAQEDEEGEAAEKDLYRRPPKVLRINPPQNENQASKPEAEQRNIGINLESKPPWRNLHLILSLQNKDIHLQSKVELAFHYVNSISKAEVEGSSQELETVSLSRVIVFLNHWVQSVLIASEKNVRAEGNKCFDHRCWVIFRFCLEESLKHQVSLSFPRDLLRVIHCIVRDVLSCLDVLSEEGKKLLKIVVDCSSLVFASHGGVSNENLDLWILVVDTTLELIMKIFDGKLSGSGVGLLIMQLSCCLLESFTKFLRVHPTRKNGFHDFIDKLLEPLMHLLDVLQVDICDGTNGWAKNVLKLVEEVLSQGLFHSTHIDGFLMLQSTGKYKTSGDIIAKDEKTVIRSYHRHLFEKLERMIVRKNAMALGGIGELFRLFVNSVKKQKGVSVNKKDHNHSHGSSIGGNFASSSRSSKGVSEGVHSANDINADTRKSLFDFFVQIMEPFLMEINSYSREEHQLAFTLSDVHCIRSTNKLLASFINEKAYRRTEDTSEGACTNFLRLIYNTTMSVSANIRSNLPRSLCLDVGTPTEVLIQIAMELTLVIHHLLDIEYEVIGDSLETLWASMFSFTALSQYLVDESDQQLFNSRILCLGCRLVDLYSEVRQVKTAIFALCKAVKHFALSAKDIKRFIKTGFYRSYACSLSRFLCCPEFTRSVCNAIKSIPEGQASGCIRQLTTDVSDSLEWIKKKGRLMDGIDNTEPGLDGPSLQCFALEAELLGRGLSEVYSIILDSVSVTTGNSSLVGLSVKGLMAAICPALSSLVLSEHVSVDKFFYAFTDRNFRKGVGSESDLLFIYWNLVFLFRLYLSCRSLCRQATSLMPPDSSKKMLASTGDYFTAYSGADLLDRTFDKNEGYFSWIVEPSAPLLATIHAVMDNYHQNEDVRCSPLIYALNVMALQRLVDINRMIKVFDYLLQRNNYVLQSELATDTIMSVELKKNRKQKRCLSCLRKEAAGLTKFMMGCLSAVCQDHFSIPASDHNDGWDLSVGTIDERSLPSALWWILCQNVDVWFNLASKKKQKKFLSFLLQNSLACIISSTSNFQRHDVNGTGELDKFTAQRISWVLLSDSFLYEQRFVRRRMASIFCQILEKSVSSLFSRFGAFDLNSPPDWQEVLRALDNSYTNVLGINCGEYDHSSPLDSTSDLHSDLALRHFREKQSVSLVNSDFAMCRILLRFFSWMPRGYLSSRALSLYANCIFNFERFVVGCLLDCHRKLYRQDFCELLGLFVSCRKTLKNLLMASSDERNEGRQFSCIDILSDNSSFPSWLLKSLSVVIKTQRVFSEDVAVQVNCMFISLIDHTSYIFLTLSKENFGSAIRSFISGQEVYRGLSSSISHEETALIQEDSGSESHDDDTWRSMLVLAETLKEHVMNSLISVKKAFLNQKCGALAESVDLRELSSLTACFHGFLWGLTFALDVQDVNGCDFRIKPSVWKLEPMHKISICINSCVEFVNCCLHLLLVEHDQLEKVYADADDSVCEEEKQNPGPIIGFTVSDGTKDNPDKCVLKRKAHSERVQTESLLTKIELFQKQCLNRSLLCEFLKGEHFEVAIFLRQLSLAASAILKLNLQLIRTSVVWSLIPVLVSASQFLLSEFASRADAGQPESFVWLDGIIKFLEEFGSYVVLLDPLLSRNLYVRLINIHMVAIGKCISLQGKGATLASRDTELNVKLPTLHVELSEATPIHWSYRVDELKSRLRLSFKAFLSKASELHVLSAVQTIERALVGVQEGCMTNYEINTGDTDGGKVSSLVAAGIDCLDLILEFVTGRRRLNVVKRHIQSLVSCAFNVILHLQGPQIFSTIAFPSKSNAKPDSGAVVLMCIEILIRVSGKHALFQMDTCHVGQSLRVPGALFQCLLQLTHEASLQPNRSKVSDAGVAEPPRSISGSCFVDCQFSVTLYSACCRLLCTILKHHKGEIQRCIGLLEASVTVLLHCLEMITVNPVVGREIFAWKVQEGVKCASCLRRVYEEIRQQKDVFGRNCFQFLSRYIWVYCGNGLFRSGIRREIDEALKPGVYALIDACSPDDLQHLHTLFGEGPCRTTLATLQHDYKQNFQYVGKV